MGLATTLPQLTTLLRWSSPTMAVPAVRKTSYGAHTHLAYVFDHLSCTVESATFLKLKAQISPISAVVSSYIQSLPRDSVIASHSSCNLVSTRASGANTP